jgi:hypothetical protein
MGFLQNQGTLSDPFKFALARDSFRVIILAHKPRCSSGAEADPADVEALAALYMTFLNGLSIQAMDGVPREFLLKAVDTPNGELARSPRLPTPYTAQALVRAPLPKRRF